jgi:hypothetical protein
MEHKHPSSFEIKLSRPDSEDISSDNLCEPRWITESIPPSRGWYSVRSIDEHRIAQATIMDLADAFSFSIS